MNKIKSVSEFKLPPKPKQRDTIMKFQNGDELASGVIGKLKDCNLTEESNYEELRPNSPPALPSPRSPSGLSPLSPRSPGSPHSPPPGSTQSTGLPKSPRLYSILGALSSTRGKEVKMCKVYKNYSRVVSHTMATI